MFKDAILLVHGVKDNIFSRPIPPKTSFDNSGLYEVQCDYFSIAFMTKVTATI